ncbi:MFS transporter [Actinoplanes sp. NEAU-A12]|uniref:MFS transporter n=1 Tax=Actinoplanes sandaracinus TaxID=3045177 RepID=A0ABT6WPL3_9ACTN|nr:MFS transporter [Actinoplanes sandaracinus]MDI6101685.1 MFS transporter [Actinoplanes sandaracinus]
MTRQPRRWLVLAEIVRLPAVPRLLVLTQLAFNIGFYLVLPFLADHLADDLGLAAATVGLVLGLRTFSQQGLFPLGGVLADRFGVRPLVLAGCAVRVAGFVVLAFAHSLPGVLAGAMLTGVAAALFSPAVESALAREGTRLEAAGRLPRTELFAMFAVAGEIGAVTGPLLGVLLLTAGFQATGVAAAVVFAAILAMHWRWLPAGPGAHSREPIRGGLREVFANRRFLGFAAANSAGLFAYHQLYLALPRELDRVGADGALGWLFASASIMVIAGQMPVTRLARTVLGPRWALTAGFLTMAAAFAVVAVLVPRTTSVLPAVALVVLLTAGQMFATPIAADVTGRFAGERRLGAYYGVVAAAGGLAVLFGSTLTGALMDTVQTSSPLPWTIVAAVPLLSAAALWLITPTTAVRERVPA